MPLTLKIKQQNKNTFSNLPKDRAVVLVLMGSRDGTASLHTVLVGGGGGGRHMRTPDPAPLSARSQAHSQESYFSLRCHNSGKSLGLRTFTCP